MLERLSEMEISLEIYANKEEKYLDFSKKSFFFT